jgi:hypothetical protein
MLKNMRPCTTGDGQEMTLLNRISPVGQQEAALPQRRCGLLRPSRREPGCEVVRLKTKPRMNVEEAEYPPIEWRQKERAVWPWLSVALTGIFYYKYKY